MRPTQHIQGLNTIRAVAASVVVLAHSLQQFGHQQLDYAAIYGVTVFFSLSGFLITLLLLNESDKFGSISLSKFYLRRTLRIWPLYYCYLIVALIVTYFFTTERVTFASASPLIFFYSNFSHTHSLFHHYWSLAVEEQFYLVWPFFMIIFRRKPVLYITLFIIAWMVLKIVLIYSHYERSQFLTGVYALKFSSLALGALAAAVFNYQWKVLDLISKPIIQIASWIAVLAVGSGILSISAFLNNEILAAGVSVIIIGHAVNKPAVNLENVFFNKIGMVSYGIYIIHPLLVWLLYPVFQKALPNSSYLTAVFFSISVLVLTTLLASLSYTYLETPFLTLKHKFSRSQYSSKGKIANRPD